MKHKITLHLEDGELKALEDLLQQSPSSELKTVLERVLAQQDQKKLVQKRVTEVIAEISGFEPEQINRATHLKNDLGMTKYHRRALKAAFQKIAEKSGSSEEITVAACENLATVDDCIKLILES
ncbi:hypothetical protein E7Z59_01260 [Robertkochia marina]|uniref:Uncharacterized protein n=1 Tax=Robertkochia marina TaxID=1227945 RepID=A0A4S3M498_9FLAO|nr:hypothetical protein [Robertkochia marina]THD68987.1 hypothetical protein E7Z59_01260 [Robertkochia marina]TRZ44809.1 hypothetical protein D3A96_07220 [Robertkochia marina]